MPRGLTGRQVIAALESVADTRVLHIGDAPLAWGGWETEHQVGTRSQRSCVLEPLGCSCFMRRRGTTLLLAAPGMQSSGPVDTEATQQKPGICRSGRSRVVSGLLTSPCLQWAEPHLSLPFSFWIRECHSRQKHTTSKAVSMTAGAAFHGADSVQTAPFLQPSRIHRPCAACLHGARRVQGAPIHGRPFAWFRSG